MITITITLVESGNRHGERFQKISLPRLIVIVVIIIVIIIIVIVIVVIIIIVIVIVIIIIIIINQSSPNYWCPA